MGTMKKGINVPDLDGKWKTALETLIALRDDGIDLEDFEEHMDHVIERNRTDDWALAEVLDAAGCPRCPWSAYGPDKKLNGQYWRTVDKYSYALGGALGDGFGQDLCDFDLEAALDTLVWAYSLKLEQTGMAKELNALCGTQADPHNDQIQ